MQCGHRSSQCWRKHILAVIGYKWWGPMLFWFTTQYCNDSLDMLLSGDESVNESSIKLHVFDWSWICYITLNLRVESLNASQATVRIQNRVLRILFPTKWIRSWILENFSSKWIIKELNPVSVKWIMVNWESEKVRICTCLLPTAKLFNPNHVNLSQQANLLSLFFYNQENVRYCLPGSSMILVRNPHSFYPTIGT